MNSRRISTLILFPLVLVAQAPRDVAPLKYWPAPMYWQPTHEESVIVTKPWIAPAAEMNPPATAPAGALVFVGMTPCRLVDTRAGFGFSGAFGPPSLVGGNTRAFPLQTSTTCTIPSNAQAYSLNLTIVPPAAMYYLTIWPVGASQPNVSTLNDLLGTVIANAAIVPAGNDGSGSVNVFVSNNTDFIMDINGYYAPQTGLTLASGTASAPSLSFSGDSGTGLYSLVLGVLNLAVGGTQAMSLGGILDDTALGVGALAKSTASNNTAVGFNAMANDTSGSNNTAVGQSAMAANTTGGSNTAIGNIALGNNTTGGSNTAVGGASLAGNTTGGSNTAVGQFSLNQNNGSNNTAVGQAAMQQNTTGCCNTAMGQAALNANTTANGNSAFGGSALQNNTTGSGNTAVGQGSLASNTTGCNNAAFGQAALNANTTACGNSAFGAGALGANTGTENVAVGTSALGALTGGVGDIAIGWQALGTTTAGNNNIAIGTQAGLNVAGNMNNIHIGNTGSSSDNDTIKIGTQGTQTSFYAAGISGVTVSGVSVVVSSTGQLGVAGVSSLRYKQDVHDMSTASDGLFQLRPVTFRYKQPYADGSQPVEYGLIAEEVASIYPDLVVRNADGQVEAVQYQKLTPMLLNELQKDHERIDRQAAEIAELKDLVLRLISGSSEQLK